MVMDTFKKIVRDYMENSSFHGAKFIIDENNHITERLFWAACVLLSWFASAQLISSSLYAYHHNAISFVAETSYRDWETDFPAIVICETKNLDRIQKVAELLWGVDHDYTLEEVLSELAYFRGESYHAINECELMENLGQTCIQSNFSYLANVVRSPCNETVTYCKWNSIEFDCCQYFMPMQTEIGLCYALNSIQSKVNKLNENGPKLNLKSNRFTGPGVLTMKLWTEANVYTIGEEDVPNLVTSKSDMLIVSPYISYKRSVSIKNIENDPQTRDVSVEQRNCRYFDENILDVYQHYSYSACSVQCRKDKQLRICNCTSHLMPNVDDQIRCNMTGLKCLNDHYEELSVVIAPWSTGRVGVVCDCLPSCTEIDISIVHDSRENLDGNDQEAISIVELGLHSLPTERYKRNVVRGKLDLVVSMGGTTGLFVGASLLSFVEIIYYFSIRPYTNICIRRKLLSTDQLQNI